MTPGWVYFSGCAIGLIFVVIARRQKNMHTRYALELAALIIGAALAFLRFLDTLKA